MHYGYNHEEHEGTHDLSSKDMKIVEKLSTLGIIELRNRRVVYEWKHGIAPMESDGFSEGTLNLVVSSYWSMCYYQDDGWNPSAYNL